jgi:hypothetical protein
VCGHGWKLYYAEVDEYANPTNKQRRVNNTMDANARDFEVELMAQEEERRQARIELRDTAEVRAVSAL